MMTKERLLAGLNELIQVEEGVITLYANFTKLWGEEGFRLVCKTISYLIENLRIQVPRLQRFINEGFVQLNDFHYTKNNNCEIIP